MVTIEDDVEFLKLQDKAPNVKIYVLLCDNYDCTHHFTKNTTTWQVNMKHEWLLNLTCRVCNTTWSICCHCNKTKSKFLTTKQINMHRLTYHGNKRKKKIIDQIYLVKKKQKKTTESCAIILEETMTESETKFETIADDVQVTNENDYDSRNTLQENDKTGSLIVCIFSL